MLYEFSFTSTFQLVNFHQRIVRERNSILFCFFQSVPLTSYLLDCIPFVMNKSSSRINGISTQNKSNGRLIKVYFKLIQLLWTKSSKQSKQFVRSFFYFDKNSFFSDIINPSSIAVEIRGINPSFRSYTQQVKKRRFRIMIKEFNFVIKKGCSRISSLFYG